MQINLSRGNLIVAACAVALFVCMVILPWFGTKFTVSEVGFALPARDVEINAFRSFALIDVVLTLAVVVAVGAAVLAYVSDDRNLHAALSIIVTAFGILATILVLYRLAVPLENTEREVGIWLAAFASAGVVIGGIVWMAEEGTLPHRAGGVGD